MASICSSLESMSVDGGKKRGNMSAAMSNKSGHSGRVGRKGGKGRRVDGAGAGAGAGLERQLGYGMGLHRKKDDDETTEADDAVRTRESEAEHTRRVEQCFDNQDREGMYDTAMSGESAVEQA